MSELPGQPQSGPLEEAQRDLLKKLLANPLEFPDKFKQWVGDYFGANVPLIPFGSILGAKINIAKSGDYITTTQGPGTASYADLATVGPAVLGLANGVYIVLWGATTTGGEHEGFMGISINGDTPSNSEAAGSSFDHDISHGRLVTVMNDHNNTIVCKYKGTQQNWGHRWIVAIRVATGA